MRSAVQGITLTLLCIALLYPCAGFADTYRWVDESGNLHLSDKPPRGSGRLRSLERIPSPRDETQQAQPEPQAPQADQTGWFWYPVLSDNPLTTLEFPMAEDWVVEERQPGRGQLPVDLEVTHLRDEGFKVLLTILPQPGRRVEPSPQLLLASLREQGVQLPASAVERFRGELVFGFRATSEDPRWKEQTPPPGEYRCMSQALALMGPYPIVYTVLSNDCGAPAHRNALRSLERARSLHAAFNSAYAQWQRELAAAHSPEDRAAADGRYRAEIARGGPEAQYLAARAALHPAPATGRPPDREQALAWYQLAASRGYRPALMKLIALQLDSMAPAAGSAE